MNSSDNAIQIGNGAVDVDFGIGNGKCFSFVFSSSSPT